MQLKTALKEKMERKKSSLTTAKQSIFLLQIHGERERVREEQSFESVRSCARTSRAQYYSSIPCSTLFVRASRTSVTPQKLPVSCSLESHTYTKNTHIMRYHNVGVCHTPSTCSFKVQLSCFAFTIQSITPDTDRTSCLTTPSLLLYGVPNVT